MFATVYKTVQELTVLMSQNERRSTSGCFYIPHTAYITPTNLTVQSPSSDSKEITSIFLNRKVYYHKHTVAIAS